MSKIVALVPLRGGSKSIPKKNIKLIAGKPLCMWVIEEALQVGEISQVYVSTESQEIIDVVKGIKHEKLHLIERPVELSTDDASTESVMLHFAEKVSFEYLVTIQATSPLTTTGDIVNGIKKVLSEDLDSLVTGVRVKRFFWDSNGIPLNYNPEKRPRRQDFDGIMMENGDFYITKRDLLLDHKCRLGGKTGILEMPDITAIELDEPGDWEKAEELLLQRRGQIDLSRIRLLVLDVDGTLTNSAMYYDNNGESFKKFNTKDGHGINLVKDMGIEVAIITGEDSGIAVSRANKLGIKHCYLGVKNKKEVLHNLCARLNISFKETAYIGDDLNDLECLKAAGFSAAPADAVIEVKKSVMYICQCAGGEGAVREVCDLIAGRCIDGCNKPY